MKIPKAKIEKAVSKEANRPHFHNVWLDAERKVLVATTGQILAAVPVETADVDTTGWITPSSIQDARKTPSEELCAGMCISTSRGNLARPSATEHKPSPYAKVLPTFRRGDTSTYSVSFDASLLLELAEAIGSLGYKENKKCRQVVLTFNTRNNEDGIIVTTDEQDNNLGCLMPMRIGTKAEDKKGPLLK